jgi:hypothetical protein
MNTLDDTSHMDAAVIVILSLEEFQALPPKMNRYAQDARLYYWRVRMVG